METRAPSRSIPSTKSAPKAMPIARSSTRRTFVIQTFVRPSPSSAPERPPSPVRVRRSASNAISPTPPRTPLSNLQEGGTPKKSSMLPAWSSIRSPCQSPEAVTPSSKSTSRRRVLPVPRGETTVSPSALMTTFPAARKSPVFESKRILLAERVALLGRFSASRAPALGIPSPITIKNAVSNNRNTARRTRPTSSHGENDGN